MSKAVVRNTIPVAVTEHDATNAMRLDVTDQNVNDDQLRTTITHSSKMAVRAPIPAPRNARKDKDGRALRAALDFAALTNFKFDFVTRQPTCCSAATSLPAFDTVPRKTTSHIFTT